MSKILSGYVEHGVRSDVDSMQRFDAAYDRFMEESNLEQKAAAGRELIRSIFGDDAIAEDQVQ